MSSVTSCTLSRHQPPSSTDELNRWTFRLNYDVETDGVLGHKALVAGAELASPHALPSYGSTYSYQGDTDTNAYAITFDVQAVDGSQKRYQIGVNFKPPDDITIFEPDPIVRPPVVWFDREAYSRIVERDNFGKAILNKCGKIYDIPYEEEDVRGVIVVEFNVLTLAEVAGYMRFLRRAVNSTPWEFGGVTFPARTVLAREVAASPPVKQGLYTYYHVSIRFVVADGDDTLNGQAPTTWDVPFLERGYEHYILDANGQLAKDRNDQLILDDGRITRGHAYAEPQNLAEDGTKLPDNTVGVFTLWRVKREVDFNLLPF